MGYELSQRTESQLRRSFRVATVAAILGGIVVVLLLGITDSGNSNDATQASEALRHLQVSMVPGISFDVYPRDTLNSQIQIFNGSNSDITLSSIGVGATDSGTRLRAYLTPAMDGHVLLGMFDPTFSKWQELIQTDAVGAVLLPKKTYSLGIRYERGLSTTYWGYYGVRLTFDATGRNRSLLVLSGSVDCSGIGRFAGPSGRCADVANGFEGNRVPKLLYLTRGVYRMA